MAKGFIPSSYFKKINTTSLVHDFYEAHNVAGFDTIPETVPKKDAVRIMVEFYQALDPSVRIDLEPHFITLAKLSTKTGAKILGMLALEKKIVMDLAEFVTATFADKVLYYALHHNELLSEALFLTEFYENKGYYTYPSPHKELIEVESSLRALRNEFEIILRKETRARFSFLETKIFDGRIHLLLSFEDYPKLSPSVNFKEGVLDRTTTHRPVKDVYFIYHPDRDELDIKYLGSKKERDLCLETVLRIVFNTVLDTKKRVYDISLFKEKTFALTTHQAKGDFLSWRLQSLSLLFIETKQTLRLAAPTGRATSDGTVDMWEIMEKLSLTERLGGIEIKSVGLLMRFTDTATEKGVQKITCSITTTSCSLGNLSPQERLAKTILKDSRLDLGFVEVIEE